MRDTDPHNFPWRIYFTGFFWASHVSTSPTPLPSFPSPETRSSFLSPSSLFMELGAISTFKWQVNITWNFLPSCYLHDQVSAASSILLLLGIPPLVAFRSSVTFILESLCSLFKPPTLFLTPDHPFPLTHNLVHPYPSQKKVSIAKNHTKSSCAWYQITQL